MTHSKQDISAESVPSDASGDGLAGRLREGWADILSFVYGLRIAWVSVASPVIGLLLFYMAPQAQDLFLEVKGNWLRDLIFWGGFYLTIMFAWALPVFVSSRWILARFEERARAFPDVKPVAVPVRRLIPPVLVVLCFIAVFAGQFMSLINAPNVDDPLKQEMIAEFRDDARKTERACSSKKSYESFLCYIQNGPELISKGLGAEISRGIYRADSPEFVSYAVYAITAVVIIWIYLGVSLGSLSSRFARITWKTVASILTFLVTAPTIFAGIAIGFGISGLRIFQTQQQAFIGLLLVALLIAPIIALLVWRQRLRALWWLGTIMAVPAVGLILFAAYGYFGIELQSDFGLTHLILLPGLTLTFAFLAWWGLRPRPDGQATYIGQSLLNMVGIKGVADEAVATTKLVNPIFYAFLFLTLVVILTFMILHPLKITANVFHRAVLLPIVLGLPVAVFTYLTHWSLRCRLPLVIIVILVVGGLGVLFGDNNKIRTVESAPARPNLQETVDRWKAVNNCKSGETGAASQNGCPHPIIVAAAGGASRAAVHVAGVLGTLLDENKIAALRGHTGAVVSARFNPDDPDVVVTASWDKTARLWNAKTGIENAVLKKNKDSKGHTGSVQSAMFSPDGTRVVTASWDKTARLWDKQTGKHIAVLDRHTGRVNSARFSPDSKRVVTSSDDKTARVWDAQTGEHIAVLDRHKGKVYSASFSPDGTRVVTASSDGTARLWNAQTDKEDKEIAVFKGHKGIVTSASFSPDGTRVVTASSDGTARLWNAQTGIAIAELIGHRGSVNSAMFSPDGTRVVTASSDKTARLWDPQTDKKDKEITVLATAVLKGHTRRVNSARFSPFGKRVVTSSDDKTARLWDVLTNNKIAVLKGHAGRVVSAMFSPNGERILTASWDGTGRIWDGETGETYRWTVRRGESFHRQLFAISAVSGGALGAVVTYAAMADAQLDNKSLGVAGKPPCKSGIDDEDWFAATIEEYSVKESDPYVWWRDCLQLLLSGDFLSSVFVGLISNDPLPIGLRGNRAAVLEQAWEARYARLTKKNKKFRGLGLTHMHDETSTLAQSMVAVRHKVLALGPNNWLPVLLLNGTSVQTGKRIVISDIDTLKRNTKDPAERRRFRDAFDFHHLLNGFPSRPRCKKATPNQENDPHCKRGDVRLSTAASISARFPIISPPGSVVHGDGKIKDHVVDGGYFENFGATTAFELAEALKIFDLEPFIILINNEPSISKQIKMQCDFGVLDRPIPPTTLWFPSLSAPFDALFGTRTARGTYAAARLCFAYKDRFAFFTVRPDRTDENKPLSVSWWLSKRVQKYLDEQLDAPNAGAFKKVRRYGDYRRGDPCSSC